MQLSFEGWMSRVDDRREVVVEVVEIEPRDCPLCRRRPIDYHCIVAAAVVAVDCPIHQMNQSRQSRRNHQRKSSVIMQMMILLHNMCSFDADDNERHRYDGSPRFVMMDGTAEKLMSL